MAQDKEHHLHTSLLLSTTNNLVPIPKLSSMSYRNTPLFLYSELAFFCTVLSNLIESVRCFHTFQYATTHGPLIMSMQSKRSLESAIGTWLRQQRMDRDALPQKYENSCRRRNSCKKHFLRSELPAVNDFLLAHFTNSLRSSPTHNFG